MKGPPRWIERASRKFRDGTAKGTVFVSRGSFGVTQLQYYYGWHHHICGRCTLSLSFSHSGATSLSYFCCLPLSFSLSPSQSFAISLCHSLSVSLFLTPSLSLSLPDSLTLAVCHSLSLSFLFSRQLSLLSETCKAMVPRKVWRKDVCFSREGGHFGNKIFWTAPV